MALRPIFLEYVKSNRIGVTIFLTNGVKLQGYLSWHDGEVLALTRDGATQLVMIKAIATVMPEQPVSLANLEEFDAAGNA